MLTSAKKLFAAQGFDKTSIREIANDSGVNSSMISYYFGGKEGMIESIFDHFFPPQPQTQTQPPQAQTSSTNLAPYNELKAIINQIISLRIYDTELIDILHSEILLKTSRLEASSHILLHHGNVYMIY